MPFKSAKQKRYMYANHPEIAKRWSDKYNKGGTVVKVKPRGFSRMLPSKRPITKIFRSQGR